MGHGSWALVASIMEGESSRAQQVGSRNNTDTPRTVNDENEQRSKVCLKERQDGCGEGKQPAACPSSSTLPFHYSPFLSDHKLLQFRRGFSLLAASRPKEAVSELSSAVCWDDPPPVAMRSDIEFEGIGLDVLLFATLGFSLREVREFMGADKAFHRARSLVLESLLAMWIEAPTQMSDISSFFPVNFAAGVASCLKGHHAWKMCCLDLKPFLSSLAREHAGMDRSLSGNSTAEMQSRWLKPGGELAHGPGNQEFVLSKAAGKKSSTCPTWVMAISDEIDETIIVNYNTGTVVAIQRGSSGGFRFSAGESSKDHVCSSRGHCQEGAGTTGPQLSVLRAALRTGEGENIAKDWSWGPWRVYQPSHNTSDHCVVHSAWEPQTSLSLNEWGFTFQSLARTITVREGELVSNEKGVFCVDDAEHRHPELLFRVGVALSMMLVGDLAVETKHQPSHHQQSKDCEKVQAMLTSDKLVEEVVTKAQLLADGGTNLHAHAYYGDTTALSAALEGTSACVYVGDQARFPQQELAEGDEVRLSPEYHRYRDAPSGPLRPADIGIIVAVHPGSNQPLRVSYGGRSWWYSREALEPLEPPRPLKLQDRCSCLNCVNRVDNKGRGALHVLASGFYDRSHLMACRCLVQAGACLHLRDQHGRTPLHCLLESPSVKAQDTSFATLRSAVKLLASERALRVLDKDQRSPILAAAQSEERGAIIVFDALLNLEFDWAWTGTSETDELLKLAIKRSKTLSSGPTHHRHAAESALARLLGKNISDTENDGSCSCPKGGHMLTLNLPEASETVAVHSALDAFGISANSQDAAFWEGVEINVSMDRLLKGGWKLHETMLYNQPTKTENLDPGKGEWLCIGAREVGKDVLLVAAMAKRQDVLRTTSTANEVNQSNGVYWYCCPGKSFGFSKHPRVDLRSADTEDTDGEYRLSWHLDSDSSGWRAGMKKNLVREAGARYEKLVFYLKSSKALSAEPYERFFIGRQVTFAQRKSTESVDPYQPVPSLWGTEIIEQVRSSSNQAHSARLKDGSVMTCWESDRDTSADRKHWLELQLKPGVTIKMLGLVVRADTAKYCP